MSDLKSFLSAMNLESFDPRAAALHHASLIKDGDLRNQATAIACGLIYVGDQLRRKDQLAEWELLHDRVAFSAAPLPELEARMRELGELLWPK